MTAYTDGILAALLRTAAVVPADGGDSRVYTRYPADLADRLPCLVVRAVPGGTAFQATADGARNVPWQLDAYTADTADGGRACHTLARTAVRALVDAARRSASTVDGSLNAISAIVGPYDAAGDGTAPGGVVHYRATGLAAVRDRF